ncbi:hypothetical protein CSAL01_08489 [Colletotrichum salicis]|uniref:DUF7918 domain-containing protein n=1 Tax=Colletotrichum salicis TaxID=1209931 RepID=A0A135TAU9_9PEZI|nr:hypothetical protein CSAL01_08489 [Colletotrichum salicis]
MAVIDGLPEIKVSIRVNGSEDDCIEYDDPNPPQVSASRGSATHTTFKVIESQVDARFSIHYEFQKRPEWINGANRLTVSLYVDGKLIAEKLTSQYSSMSETIISAIDGFRDKSSTPGKEVRRHFKFAPIKTGIYFLYLVHQSWTTDFDDVVERDNERLTADLQIAKHLGIIEVIVYRVKVEGLKPRKPIAKDNTMRIARFFFRYKPRTFLQVDGIIPRDPSPEPTPSPSPPTVANLPLADIMRLAQERLEQLEPHVKREPGTSVKREADEKIDSRPHKVYKVDADGTIDLSDDGRKYDGCLFQT